MILSSPANYLLNPYLALGLQRNPFTLESGAAIAPTLWIDRGYSKPPSPKAKQFIQLIGVKGAGKTSHLKYWQARTGGAYTYYPPDLGRLKMPIVGPIAYWDEADRIPLPYLLIALATAARRHSTIVVGTHADLRLAARMVGLSVKTICIKPFDELLLLEWVNRRIEAVRVPDAACHLQLDKATARGIVATVNGSWRDAADQLHIWAAAQASCTARSVATHR